MIGQENPKWNEQVALEEEMRALGIERYRLNVAASTKAHQESRTAPGRRLLVDAHDKVLAGVLQFFADCESGKAGPKHTAYKALEPIRHDPDLIAHAALRRSSTAIAQHSAQPSTTASQPDVGNRSRTTAGQVAHANPLTNP